MLAVSNAPVAMHSVDRVVYTMFEVSNMARWRDYLHVMYGLKLKPAQRVGEYEALVDDTGCRLLFRHGETDDAIASGWQTKNLDALYDQIKATGAKVEWASDEDAAARGSDRMLRTIDPAGVEVECFENTDSAHDFEPAAHGNVFQAGELGFGNLTFNCADPLAYERFYVSALGLKVTDYNQPTIGPGLKIHVAFFRANARHHSTAVAGLALGSKRLNHFQLEVPKRNEVGRGFDRLRRSRHRIAQDVGVHPNDDQISFYAVSPSGFHSELGAESRLVEDNAEVMVYNGISVWGHSMSLMESMKMAYRVLPVMFLKLIRRDNLVVPDLPDGIRAEDAGRL